jgi:hypothetical protein
LSNAAGAGDRVTLDNKTEAATYYAANVGTGFTRDDAKAAVADVDGTRASVLDSESATDGGTQTSGTFTLTAGVDNLTGTANNDTFNGLAAATLPADTDTLTAVDIIKGGAGVDTLNITTTATNTDATGGALISEIENVYVRANAGIATVDASSIAGLQQVWSNVGAGAVTVTNLATDAAIGVQGNGTVENGAVIFDYATATDAVTLALAGGTQAGTTVTASAGAATAATIASTGAANTIGALDLSATANTLTSLNIKATTGLTATLVANDYAAAGAAFTVTGAGPVNVGALGNFKTIDASTATGGLTVTIDTVSTSVKGSTGNDVITSAATTATTAGLVDAGAGTDTLVLAATVATAAEGAEYVNFETLRTADSQDVSLIAGITKLEVNAATSETFSKLGAALVANDITVLGDQTTAATFTLADATGSADSLTLNLASATAATNVDIAGLSVVGVETLNLNATTGTAGTSSDVAFAVGGADKLTAINFAGTADVSLSGTNTAKAVTVVSTTTGIATVLGNFVNASSITTGAGKDVVTLGTGFGTYSTGMADDVINGTAAQLNTGALYNAIDGGAGTDTLNITGAVALTLVDNNLSKVSNVEKIVVTDTTTNDQSITTGGFFNTAFLTDGVDLTTTASTGNITVDMTSFTGAATVSATTVGTGNNEGAISIQTGSGADTITVSAAVAGDAGVVSTFGGNDKITTASDEVFTITGGAGNDTLVFGSTGADTAVFEATAALNGVDTITGFDKTTDIINWVQGGAETVVTGALTTADDVMYQLGGLAAGKADTAADVAAAVSAAATWTAAAATAWLAVSDDNSTSLYEWTDVAGTDGVQANEITLVGTFDAAMTTAELATAITIV